MTLKWRFWSGVYWEWPRRQTVIQATVFMVSCVLCVVLYVRTAAVLPDMVGMARGQIVELGVPWAARVDAVPVEMFQRVRQDEIVAMLDDSVLQAQIVQVEAEIARLRSEYHETEGLLRAEFGEREADWDAESRSFARDKNELSIRLREVRVDLEYDRALLEGLQANVRGLERLVERGHSPRTDLELARAEALATARRCKENEGLEADLVAKLNDAESRQERHREFEPKPPPRNSATEQLMQAIDIQRGMLLELEAQRERCILRSPIDGVIVAIGRRAGEAALQRPGEGDIRYPGEVVGPGDAVVAVAAERAAEVVAYLPGDDSRDVEVGMPVELVRTGSAPQIAPSSIVSVGPTVEQLPPRLWRMQVPAWGRPVIVPIPPGLELLAGDRVGVRFP